jgi:hypothetical protein
MTTSTDPAPPHAGVEAGEARAHDDRSPSPVGELVVIVAMYVAYSVTRNLFGSASVAPEEAYANALRIIDLEEALGIYHELSIQRAFLDHDGFIRFWNVFYGSFHFIVPIGVLVLLWQRSGRAYRRWRTTIVIGTLLALVGFSLYPLMPPRLMCDCEYGAGIDHGYVDTLATVGGLWDFDSGGIAAVSNQYAAMPSLHVGWALWCAAAAASVARRRWVRWAVWGYPLATTFAVVVTGNHFLLDAVGGAAVMGAGLAVATAVERLRRRPRPDDRSAGDGPGVVTGTQHGATVRKHVPDEPGRP